MKKYFWIVLALIGLLLEGCSNDPVEGTLSEIQSMNRVLETNKENGDALLKAFGAFVKAHKGALAKYKAEAESLDPETLEDLEAKYERDLHREILKYFDLVLEIQDRLSDDPEQLQAFLDLLSELGEVQQ